MQFVTAKCPQCGGNLQLDNTMETGFCMHCGSKIMVQDAIRAVRVDNTHMIDTWMKMGNSAAEVGNNEEAYEYFTKIIEVDPNNWIAIINRGKAAAWLSSLEKPKLAELIQSIKQALIIIDNSDLDFETRIILKNPFSSTMHNVTDSFMKLVEKRLNDLSLKVYDNMRQIMNETFDFYEMAVNCYQVCLDLVYSFNDSTSEENKIIYMKKIVKYCLEICGYEYYYTDYTKTEFAFAGFLASDKKPFIDLYDKYVIEIRKKEPSYRTNYEYDFIDSLDRPDKMPDESRRRKLIELERTADRMRW